jgi:hypothetical protein
MSKDFLSFPPKRIERTVTDKIVKNRMSYRSTKAGAQEREVSKENKVPQFWSRSGFDSRWGICYHSNKKKENKFYRNLAGKETESMVITS